MKRRTRSKYGNRRIEVDGEKFDSVKEYNRYMELLMLQKKGIINSLQRQVTFELQPAFYHKGKKIRPINYVADFTYYESGEYIVEDVKGVKTREYTNKKKNMLYIYGIEIKET